MTNTDKTKITAKKWNGDDTYSWAVFVDGRPAFTGLSKAEVPHYKTLAAEIAERRTREEGKR